jgi:hypothetical protein
LDEVSTAMHHRTISLTDISTYLPGEPNGAEFERT